MTNKPMLSVERELLKAMHSHPDCPVEFIDHLRRAISQPAGSAFKRCTILKECSTSASATTAAAQHQGEPAAFEVDVSGYTIMLAKTADKAEKTAQHYRAMSHTVDIRPLFRRQSEQPAPVAVVMPDFEAACGHLVETAKDSNGEYINSYAIIGAQIWEIAAGGREEGS